MKTRANYARLVAVGKRQAVLLPMDVKFEGKRISVHAFGRGLLIEPVEKPMFRSTKEWFAALDACPVSPDFLRDLRD